jgi:methyl-accepting chemotaxis protein
MATLSIKAKVGATTILCLSIGTIGLLELSDASYRKNVRMVTGESLANARATYSNLVDASVAKMAVAAEMTMADPLLRETFAAKDRAKLIDVTLPIFDRLKQQYGITIFNYIDQEENRFLTMTDTKDVRLIGTKALRFNVQECGRIKTWVTGLALGQLGFALRVTHPFYDSGQLKGEKLLGYIELGSEIGGFLGALKKQTGREYGLLLRKQFLKERDWSIQRDRLKLPNNWNDQKDLVLAGNTWTDESIFTYSGDVTALPDEGQVLDLSNKAGQIFARSAFPIRDVSSAKVGAVFVLVDITSIYTDLQQTKKLTIATTVALIVVVCVVLLLLLSSLVFRRLAEITRVATRLVGGDYQTPVTSSKSDEIGHFEELFEQLRLVFVNLLEEYERVSRENDEKSKPGN